MYNDLSPNLKSSITRSITQTFEQYMESIGWSESKFRIEDFISSWREYITTRALWYSEISDTIKANPEFHEQLATRINEVMNRILEDPPTDEQIARIQIMQEKLNTHYTYDCKAEASYVERLLKKRLEMQ
ncbi:hypothetical protein [Sporosarcina ureilytica]|uniref:Group-specific protein n=1 Tax=Sporosarcina ureilytica TaxID=298596 RepID=A0A1D8JJC9_9BACL|nr:hypothetical protein [Sporosarcina ureilytica]AOV08814.1 hypothetical protein BI350_15510 [Sporosarcina ureilytica]